MSSSLLPIGLCLVSAVTVAATNLFVKRGGDVLSTRLVVSIAMALSVLPFVLVVPAPRGELWLALLVSVVVHWFYQFCMIRAMHRGDLSLVFPVMRGLAPLLTAILGVAFLSETPSLIGWVGLFLATLALIVFGLPDRARPSGKALQQAALFWAAFTALGIAGYSVVDARSSRIAADQSTVFTFVVWLFLFDWIGITVAAIWARGSRLWSQLRPRLKDGVIGGTLGTISYGAALWAFTLAPAANVTAVRETSVVFGAIFGAVFLKESFGTRRIIAASILAFGLILLEFAP